MLEVAEFVLDIFVDERSELLMVMVFTPFFMNALQFWVVDNFSSAIPESMRRCALGVRNSADQSLRRRYA